MLPSLVEEPPEGDDWSHEIKFDGYRSQLVIDDGGIRMFTRNGHDWTAKYGPLVNEARGLDVESAIIDGEIIVLNEAGLSDFGQLRSAIVKRPQDLYFVGFDLLHLNGHDLRRMSLEERRHILADLIPEGRRIQFSQAMEGNGAAILAQIEAAGLEEIVSKRLSSRYESGRTMNWRKIKSLMESELEILGIERERGKPAFALMAKPGTGRYVGSAFVTLNREMRERLWKRVQEKPGTAPKEMQKRPDTQWTRPGLIAREASPWRGETAPCAAARYPGRGLAARRLCPSVSLDSLARGRNIFSSCGTKRGEPIMGSRAIFPYNYLVHMVNEKGDILETLVECNNWDVAYAAYKACLQTRSHALIWTARTGAYNSATEKIELVWER